MNLAAGDSLGKYLIVGTLGRGAMGTVYDARDPVIDRRVAIKTIPLVPADDDEGEALARFKREAQAAGRLHHPNIVGVYDYGETEHIAYIIMEFVEGRSLKAPLDAHERFTPAETGRIMQSILAGLQYSHGRGVVHRDIKPANIMLTQDGAVKIADFGIARIESSQMTQAGTIMGTPAYMSPEQFMGQTVDLRTDIYSAGVLLYQLLTGERPFDGGMSAIMHKALHTEPPAPSAISVVSPAGFDAVVVRAMAKRPEQRYQSADDFAAAIRTALAAPGGAPDVTRVQTEEATIVYAPRPPAAPALLEAATARRPSRLALLALGGAGILALAGLAAFLLLRPAPQPATPPVPPPQPAEAARPSAPPAAPPRPAPVQADRASLPHLTEALSKAPCSLALASIADGAFTVDGIVSQADEAGLRAAASASVPGAPIAWHLSVFAGPYCEVLDAIRPQAAADNPPAGLSLGLRGAPAYLAKNALLMPHLGLPDFPSYLTVDYFSSDGLVVHLAPLGRAHEVAHPAGASLTYGTNPKGKQYPAGPPYGTDMILATAANQPLFDKPRPETEPAAVYLAALKQALSETTQVVARIEARSNFVMEARAILVETREK